MADLEELLNKANAEAAACRERIREFEEEVYGRLTNGCQAAAAKAQQALQVHMSWIARSNRR